MRTGSASPVPHVRARRPLRRIPTCIVVAMTAACLAACSGGRAAPAIEPDTTASFAADVSAHGDRPSAAHAAAADRTASAATPHGKMMPGRVYAPTQGEVACPSHDFEEFLQAFFNSGDLQVRFTARPVAYKVPYYGYHNTEPGDPAHPQWEHYESEQPMHDRYRYDIRRQAFVWDTEKLAPGIRWTGLDADGTPVERPVIELQIRQISDGVAEVTDRDRIMIFSRRPECWYFTADWSLDPFEGCVWPDACRQRREYEATDEDE